MGHIINHAIYSKKVNKKAVQTEWDEIAARDDREEGCSGLPRSIRWIEHLCASEEEALSYIESHDSGWYDQLAVMFRKGHRINWLVKTEYHV